MEDNLIPSSSPAPTTSSGSNKDIPKPMVDVAHPSTVVAQQTSKPVITNNQPIGRDPMMNQTPSPQIESRIVSKMPADKLHQEMNAPVAPVAEQGTLHDMFPNDQLIGHVKPKGRKRRILRIILLVIGFLITLAAIGYYLLTVLNSSQN